VGDLNLWNASDLGERFYSGKSRALHGTHLTTGDRMWSSFPQLRPMATITKDTLGWYLFGQLAQTIRSARTAVRVVGDVATDAGGRGDDVIPRFGQRHEGIEIGDGTGWHAGFGIIGLENFSREFGGDHLDLLYRLQPCFVFVTGVAKRGAGARARGKRGLGSRVHYVCGGGQVETVAFVYLAVFDHQGIQLAGRSLTAVLCGASRDILTLGAW